MFPYIFRYKYRDGSQIGPKSMKVCKSYEEAQKQYRKANLERLNAVVESSMKVAKFGNEEAVRMMAEQGEGFEEEEKKEREKEMEEEVSANSAKCRVNCVTCRVISFRSKGVSPADRATRPGRVK